MIKYRTLFFLGIIGLGLSVYLFWTYSRPEPVYCGVYSGCEVVRESPYSTILGLPVPFIGVIYYSIISIFSWWKTVSRRMGICFDRIMGCVVVVASLFSVYLLFVQLIILKSICFWCLGSEALSLIVFGIYFLRTTKSLV